MGEILKGLGRAVLEADEKEAVSLSRRALDCGLGPLEVIEGRLVPGINEAGRLWDEGEYFLPKLVGAAQAMKAAMEILEPALAQESSTRAIGRAVIGTVQGDIHDIGKTLVAPLLSANRFAVADEGGDVTVDRFVERARELDADIVCASALLTTTMARQKDLVVAIRAAGLRAKVCVGGAPVTKRGLRRSAPTAGPITRLPRSPLRGALPGRTPWLLTLSATGRTSSGNNCPRS